MVCGLWRRGWVGEKLVPSFLLRNQFVDKVEVCSSLCLGLCERMNGCVSCAKILYYLVV